MLKWGPVKMLSPDGVWTETPGPASTDESVTRKDKLRQGKIEAKKGKGIFDNDYYYGGQYRDQTPEERKTTWKCSKCGTDSNRHGIFGDVCKKCQFEKGEVQ